MNSSRKASTITGFDRLIIRWLPKLATVALIAVVFMGTNLFIGSKKSNEDIRYIRNAGDLKILSQQIAKNAPEAAAGKQEAFKGLESATNRFKQIWTEFREGNSAIGLEAPGDATVKAELDNASVIWEDVQSAAERIIAEKDAVFGLQSVAKQLSQTVPDFQEKFGAIVDQLLAIGASARQVNEAAKQSWYAERMLGHVQKILRGGDDALSAAKNFDSDAENFGRILEALLKGSTAMNIERINDSKARRLLQETQDAFGRVYQADYITKISTKLQDVREGSDTIFDKSKPLLEATHRLTAAFEKASKQRIIGGNLVSIVLGSIIIICLILMFLAQRAAQKQRLEEARQHLENEATSNKNNQDAIMRLLNEMEPLSEGDLTVNMTVTEDFTGAIADSVNFTIEAQRNLVSTINNTVQRVNFSIEETQNIANQLSEASDHQAQEIAGASAAINEMAVSIEQVSTNASESTQVAERSVKLANKGADVVRNTIKGMDNIREHIQETSKRIKRLSESSQEIGDIVSLISDIADQTNILALNAAIQAAMAGEAGRGFAVVADEVQRLAERSSNATKQIEALVKTIQTDTNEAVISMEQSTSEVVQGAHLAQDAGVALEEIENVSNHLADLIQNISNAARQQAASANHVSNTMNVIQEITNQTSSGTSATAGSIGKLSELADELRASVAGFKLPKA